MKFFSGVKMELLVCRSLMPSLSKLSKILHFEALSRNFCTTRNFSSSRWQVLPRRYCSSNQHINLNFPAMMEFRQKQAASSVLLELLSKDDATHAANFCAGFGSLNNCIQYSGDLGGLYLLVEFEKESAAWSMLKRCQFRNLSDSIPCHTRFLQYEPRKKKKNLEKSPVIISADRPKTSAVHFPTEPSQMIEAFYETEKQSDLSIRRRFLFAHILKEALSGMFPYCAILPFGSSVNGFGKNSSDLDLMVRLYPDKSPPYSEAYFSTKTCVGDIRVLQQRSISCIYEILRAFIPGVTYVQRIMNARVPILKFKQKILDLECDISVNNMAAVYMSELLFFCGEIDSRVRPLVAAVKKWAKEASITYEAPGTWITNFSLTLLVLFFLQNRPVPVLPPLTKAVDLSACYDTALSWEVEYQQQDLVWKKLAKTNTESLESLLREFFQFLNTFKFENKRISILSGEATARSDGYPIWIEYPLEEDKNVARNMSLNEVENMSNLAGISLRHMSSSTHSNVKDFMALLGFPELQKHSKKIDINDLYSDTSKVAAKRKA